jgi:GT2 family glycosyltransferase
MDDEKAPDETDSGATVPSRIAVAIVNYNSAELVIEGLPGLVEQLRRCAAGVAIVVDNASPEGDGARLEAFLRDFPGRDAVRLIRSPVNGGFAAGNNIAFAALGDLPWRADAVMLLNPDAALEPGALAALAAVMAAQPRAGVVGAALENDDGTVRPAAFRFPDPMREFARDCGIAPLQRLFPSAAATGPEPCRVDWVTGAAMLVRRELIEAIGPMDEGFFLYFEETDFMHRARRAGWEVWHAPQARVRHRAGSSTGIVGSRPKQGRMPAYWFASWLRYHTKTHGVLRARLTAACRLAGVATGAAVRALRGRSSHLAEGFAADFARACLLAPLGAGRGRA